MADYQLRARIPHELADEVKAVIETINESVPGAEATFSTVARYALQDYAKRFHPKIKGETLFLELPIKDLKKEQLEVISKALQDINSVVKTADVERVKMEIENKILSEEIAELMAARKAVKGGENNE
ncbi:hypothetical protein [Neobacillus sp. PS3-40]|uniref:hypothetical protein n=1 Tax=Neobacillus sp. PS3-40 TaxID=3070679 RepID=UPI0027E2075F|nr:hypothetical protein [Neobacillus sp. PS3-40]WML42704.1 hypothetical protein RCG20_12720 [Neobacillus sp. PS3-40]